MKNQDKQRERDSIASARNEIESVRKEIDELDGELLRLLSARRERSVQAAITKEVDCDWFRDKAREEQLLVDRIRKGRDYGLDSNFVTRVFQEIVDDSLWIQQEHFQERANEDQSAVRVAFQGIEGSYSHLAATQYLSRRRTNLSYLGCSQFSDVVEAVEKGRADLAMLPIENTTSGGINEVYDLLLHARLSIVGEIKFKVKHCLLGLPSATLEGLETIYCHPQTVLQCSKFISTLSHCKVEYFTDTALSGKKIKEDGEPSQAAIASEEAARHFDLSIIKRGIANQEENYTRFLVAARKPIKVDGRIPCKTSIVMSTGNKPGSLLETLLVFREYGINLTKLESRPIMENPWEEMFYVDFEGNLEEERIQMGIDEVTKKARYIKVLGCYPSQDLTGKTQSAERMSSKAEVAAAAAPNQQRVVTPPEKPGKPTGYRLGSRDYKAENSVIELNGVSIGGDDFVVIAGPCAVESREQIFQCAREVKERGAHILRGGCFKPRTSPYSFQGLGYEGLEMLVEAGKKFGLAVVSEVLSPDDVQRVAEKVDILQVGARNMQNFTLLSEVGRTHRPVMLKRGMSSSVNELLQAAEYILAGGNQQVFLCERGIRTFETATRNTLDLGAVAVLKSRTHLPIIADPSHAAGKRALVHPLSMAAKAVGAHGIMIEIHPNPTEALSDGPQSLTFPEFEALMADLQHAPAGT